MSDEQKHPEEKGRTQKQVSDDIQSAGFDPRNPNQPKAEVEPEPAPVPDPKAKSPEEMDEPGGALNPDETSRPY